MPRGEVKTDYIQRNVFFAVLKAKKSSIRKLGKAAAIKPTEKTIRRQLNEKHGLRKQYIDQIAKYLDVDPRLLTGAIISDHPLATEQNWKDIFIEHLEDYPFSREEQDRLKKEDIRETFIRVLSLFDIPYPMYLEMDFEDKYSFQHDLLSSISNVMNNHFPSCGTDKIIIDLENYRDDYYIREYAEHVLRAKFLKAPPHGYGKKRIEKMSADELVALDMEINNNSTHNAAEASIEKKYADLPVNKA